MRTVLRVLGALALAGAGLVGATPGVGAQTVETFIVPAGVCQVTIAAWGASGEDDIGSGGDSGRIQADFTVSPGDVLTVTIASGRLGFNDGGIGGFGDGGGSSAV